MKLTVKDRVLLGGILPARSSLSKMRVKAEIRKKVGFSDEEEKEIKMKVDQASGKVEWNQSKAKEIDVDFTPDELALINEQIDLFDTEAKVTDDYLQVFEKFKGAV